MLTQHIITHSIVPLDAYRVALTIELPCDIVDSFVSVFSSMTDLCRSLKVKVHNETVQFRIDESAPARQCMVDAYLKSVISTFDRLIENGDHPRAALSLTVSMMSQQFPTSSFDQVKQILTKSKRLKKTGFYKKPR